MLTKRNWLVIGISAVLLIGIGVVIIFCINKPQSSELLLSDYPELFEHDAMIIVGGNASQIELESAEEIAAKLKGLNGNKPEVKSETEVSKSDKENYNLILIGTAKSNGILQEVYEITGATRITAKYPGKSAGILEILRSPWNEDKALLLVGGSDEVGIEYLAERLTDPLSLKGLEYRNIIIDRKYPLP